MKNKSKFMALGVAILCMFSSVTSFAGNTTITRDNYSIQFYQNWCWGATAQNFVIALEKNKSKPTTAKQEYDQYSIVYDVCKDWGRGVTLTKVPSSAIYTSAYYNSVSELQGGGGLAMCVDAANQYCKDKGYTHEIGFMSSIMRYAFFVSDIERFSQPYGLFLNKSGSGGGVNAHMVLACGVNNTNGAERVTIFDPAGNGTYVTLAYSDLVAGSSAFSGLAYTGTMYCNDN